MISFDGPIKMLNVDEQDRAKLLFEISKAVVANFDFQRLLQNVAECLLKRFAQTSSAALSLYDAEINQLIVYALALKLSSDFLTDGTVLPPNKTPGSLSFTTRSSVLFEKLTMEDFPSDLVRRAIETNTISICSAPLSARSVFF
jgi:transcriptional regulator with GAF, ATPase, and Fis domain